ncbi:hypothetical protein J7E50_02730 [Pedobacter sp. ISL-68]|uniref:hypothetical protein n=1 Tax=unclassified Pedobacter TaxID=2628915 RepID=UPI001BE8493B|nr:MULTISPECIES: hypothetical protein [unclassified Pedobacter]MBT2560135.1 hypothetical protein [Pedobacter sp. ISL-64]MBT2589114.1 hypothetical protein [Pedobacter sp. ISL-68]
MDELTGTYVLVHPQLPSDPAARQGQIGMITYADLEKDDVYVSFGKDGPALYAADALMVLKKPGDIYTHLMNEAKNLTKDDYKTLFQINLLQSQGDTKQIRSAMEMARDNSAVRDFSMTTLDKLELRQAESREKETSVSLAVGR